MTKNNRLKENTRTKSKASSYQIGRGRVVKVGESAGNGGNSGEGYVEISTGRFGMGAE